MVLTSISGFGVDEYPLPMGSNISLVNMLSRHGSRYPTSNSSQMKLGASLKNATTMGAIFSGPLAFLNTWTYKLGAEILVPKGRQEYVRYLACMSVSAKESVQAI